MSKDTDLSGGFPGIGSRENPFTGSYDGNGYQITNLHYKYRDELMGFFRYIKGAEIKNLTIGKTTVTDSEKQLQEYFKSYENDAPHILSQYPDRENLEVGGVLVAYNDGGMVWNCHSKRSGFGTRFNSYGGLVGYNGGVVAYSSSHFSLSAPYHFCLLLVAVPNPDPSGRFANLFRSRFAVLRCALNHFCLLRFAFCLSFSLFTLK